jgi:transmembrane sensor
VNSPRGHSTDIATEAAGWLLDLQAQPDSLALRGQFVDWLRRSPVHVEEYLRLLAIQADLATLPAWQRLDVDALIAAAREVPPATLPLHATGPEAPDSPAIPGRSLLARYPWRAALAACVILALAWVLLGSELAAWRHTERFATVDEVRAVRLADGSRIHINSRSELAVRIDPSRRELQLEQGEALFEVAHDPEHPFRVHTPNAVVVAHGTEFDVRVRDGQTEVVLLEGHVEVESPTAMGALARTGSSARNVMLQPGEAVTVADPTVALHPHPADVTQATAWLRHLLVFDDATLAQVVTEFNLHAAEPLVIDDPAIGEVRVTLTLDSAEPPLLAKMIEAAGNLRVTHGADGRWHVTRP